MELGNKVGQSVQIKLSTYSFQRCGMLHGKLIHLSADATESSKPNASNNANMGTADNTTSAANTATYKATYKARIKLDQQTLVDAKGHKLAIAPGMQVVAEVNQGKRSVLDYLLSPVQKAIGEAGRER